MDAQELRNLQEAYLNVYEDTEQLDEISLKTKMKAYATTQDPEADYYYGRKVHAQGDRLRAAIVKKHGEKAGEHADAHADASHWGRKDASGKKKGFAQSRTDTPNKYRTRADGKMHGQDQNKLKAKLKRRMGIGEEYDLYDIILSHLLDEGYAETIESAEAIMVNMSEDWRDSIVDEAYVPLRNDDGTETDKWFRAKGKKQNSVGRSANRIRHGIGNQEKNMSQLTSAAKRLGAVNQVDKESESERRRRSEAKSASNRARGAAKG